MKKLTSFHRQNAGFTLIEVLIAIIITGVMMVGFLKLQTASVIVRAHAKLMTLATESTSSFLDQVKACDPDNITIDGNSISDNGTSNVSIPGSNVNFSRYWVIDRDPGDLSEDFMRITVWTCWKEPGEPDPTRENCISNDRNNKAPGIHLNTVLPQ